MHKFLLFFVASVFLLASCTKDETQFLSYAAQLAVDTKIIDDYLSANDIIAQSTSEGLKYEITTVGNGDLPAIGNTVVVNYAGKFMNGNEFDSNTNGGFEFLLGQGRVIQGWDIGIALLNKGAKTTLYLPYGLAYGTRVFGGAIGPNVV